MPSWLNGKLTKWQVDKMPSWQNGKLTKCQVNEIKMDKIVYEWNGISAKCQVYKMSIWKKFVHQFALLAAENEGSNKVFNILWFTTDFIFFDLKMIFYEINN